MILVKRFVGQDQNFFVSFEFDAQGYWPMLSSVEFKSQLRNVRFGSKADIGARPMNVGFTPESGHWNSVGQCPLCAKSGHQVTSIRSPRRHERVRTVEL